MKKPEHHSHPSQGLLVSPYLRCSIPLSPQTCMYLVDQESAWAGAATEKAAPGHSLGNWI